MNNSKSNYIIDKSHLAGNIHVVGVGATGSQLVENLIRLNLSDKVIIYDYDVVEEVNLNNQAYLSSHIGMSKVDAMVDISKKINPSGKIRTYNKKVKSLKHSHEDVIFILTDNYTSRIDILSSLRGTPLVLTGGISSTGGGIEIVRGVSNYDRLMREYKEVDSADSTPDPNDLTPCGSPISIYHRIRIVASLFAEALVKYHKQQEDMFHLVKVDVPCNILIEENGY